MLNLKFLLRFYFTLELIRSCTGAPPPVRNFTTITLYTEPRTWNEAVQICEDRGGRILDITYYSLFSIMLTFTSDSPWKDLLIANGPPAWIGLHRRITPLGDLYYSSDCQRLKDYKVVYWNTDSTYTLMDGDPASFCVYHQINKSTNNQVISYKHDFTRASCHEQHQFYCLSEDGPCTFEMVPGFFGDTSHDFTPNNDGIHPYESEDHCAELCLNAWSVYPHPNLHVVEECWGFTTSATECRLHNVLKPSYFDTLSNRIETSQTNLFIKRCFSSAVNTDEHPAQGDTSTNPNTTCGKPMMGNSTMIPLQVFVYLGRRTWNEAFKTCKDSGLKLLQIQHQGDYAAVQQIVNKYAAIQSMNYVWLGLHVPDPLNHTNTRVWSDCSISSNTNWDPSAPPSTSITDTSLCTILDTSSNFWYTVMCNEQNYFVCTGDNGDNFGYNDGISNTVGSEISLGPYKVTESSCREMCSTLTFENQECWGYAALAVVEDSNTECYLYFINSSNPILQMEPSNKAYKLFVKVAWTDSLLNDTDVTDSSLIPISCCDVQDLISECPENNPPIYSETIPTAEKLQFVLYRNLATWNEALSACRAVGGTLAQLNDVTKRLMLQRYLDVWITNGYISDDVWVGLSQLHLDDPCSLRWAGDCSVPTWTSFTDRSYTDFSSTNYCSAVDAVANYVKRPCDQQLKFVCEIKAGVCDMQQIVYDTNCNLGSQGAILAVSSATCLADCETMTYNNMECWAAVTINKNTCHLMFYVDPEYCKDYSITMKGVDVHFKTCYSATAFDNSLPVPADDSIFPKTFCSNLIPVELSAAVCIVPTPTPTLATSSTTLSGMSPSVLQSAPASSTSLLQSVSAFSPSMLQSVSISTPVLQSISASLPSMLQSVSASPSMLQSVSAFSTSLLHSISPSTLLMSTHVSLETLTLVTNYVASSASWSSVNPSVTSMSSTEFSVTPTGILSTELRENASSSVLPTTKGINPLTSFSAKPIFIWPCLCYAHNKTNMTIEEWHEWFVLRNTIDRHNTSRYRRKLSSGKDQRTSSITLGMTGSSVLVALAVCLIVADVPRIFRSAINIHGNELKTKQQKRMKT